MALINCVECGKEISDQARSCPNCGRPIFKEVVKTMEKKRWEELTEEEKNKITSYRKLTKQWWEVNRTMGAVCALIAIIMLAISFIFETFTLMGIIFLLPALFFVFNSTKEQAKWYEDNIDIIYENEILK